MTELFRKVPIHTEYQ